MTPDASFAEAVKERSGQDLAVCYHCLKCTAGCPLSSHMDLKPNGILRMIQYGQRERVLKSHAIWFCVSCMTCGVRCPNEVDISAIMDTLRDDVIARALRRQQNTRRHIIASSTTSSNRPVSHTSPIGVSKASVPSLF